MNKLTKSIHTNLFAIGFALMVSPIYSLSCKAQEPAILGKVTSASITEISGITPYSYEAGYFWVHNDSGDKSAIYLINSQSQLKATVHIKDVNFIDIEEIGYCFLNGIKHLIIADTGNNQRNRKVLKLYFIPEPQLHLSNDSTVDTSIAVTKTLTFSYEDKARDAESFFVDPVDEHIYIFSKRDFKSQIFKLSIHAEENHVHQLKVQGQLPFTFTTAADISADGKHILIKNITSIYYWERTPGISIMETLSKKYKIIPYKLEPQGEALCFDLNKRYFYTISERPLGLESYLYKYEY